MSSKVYKGLFLVIGLLTLAYLVDKTGLDVIWANLRRTGVWFIPIIGSWLVIYGLNAFAFKAIIQEPALPESDLPMLTVLKLTITGYAINYITPFVALGGEPYRIMELKPALGLPKATSSVLLYGLMHMFSHVLFWLASVVLIVVFVPINTILLVGCGAMLLTGFVLGYWFIRMYQKGFLLNTVRVLGKIPFLRERVMAFADANADTLINIDHQIRILYADRKPRFYTSLLLEFTARVVGCAEIYFSALAIGLNLSVMDALLVSSGSSLLANLVFFFPLQLGTREGGLVLALKSIGLPATSGLFIGMVMRIRELTWILIGLLLMQLAKQKPAPVLVNEELLD